MHQDNSMSPRSVQRFWGNDMHQDNSMSPKTARRFWENDMHQNQHSKRVA
ncbi:hypothetical protein [Mesorhizobium sp. J8]|nr:hypothetical protein [Mesorhizobium sp. J8]